MDSTTGIDEQVLIRFLPGYEARGDGRGAVRLSASSLSAGVALVIVLCAGVHLFRERIFGFAGDGVGEGLYLWFYLTTLGVTVKLILYGALNGARRLVAQTVLEVGSLLAVLLWIILTHDTLSVVGLFRILGVVHIATIVIGLPAYFLIIRQLKPQNDAADSVAGSERYLGYWAWASGLSLVALAFTDVDRYLLAHVLTLETLALFHIVSRISRLAHRVLGVANLSLQPEISRLDAEARRHSIESATTIFLKLNVVVSVVVAVAISVFAGELIALIASKEYLPASALLIVLVVALPVTTMTAPLTTAMKATDQVRAALWTDLAWAGTYIVLIFVLGSRFGLMGVGVAHVFAALVQLLLAVRLSNLSISGSLLATLSAKLVLSAALVYWPFFAVPFDGWSMSAEIGVKVVLFGVGSVLFMVLTRRFAVFSGAERSAIGDVLTSKGLGRLARFYS